MSGKCRCSVTKAHVLCATDIRASREILVRYHLSDHIPLKWPHTTKVTTYHKSDHKKSTAQKA
eukprot:1294873-Amorphochlora_amoeboformis.AAC.2